ncbi:MAG TPA: acetolactate synthase small subunit [Clostridiales bacterium]|nr:acetolactate synthase small subunit [Clostridiales bacterium]
MQNSRKVISILVDNKPNTLARISSLVGRRNYNIETITASETHMPGVTLITLVVTDTDPDVLDQIVAHIEKLEPVREVHVMDSTGGLYRELLLLKVIVDKDARSSLVEIAEVYRAKIIDLSRSSMIIELTGEPSKLDGFMDLMSEYELVEVCRTGVTGMNRGM